MARSIHRASALLMILAAQIVQTGVATAADAPLVVALGTSARFGNPYSSTSIGELASWSSVYDPLTLVTTRGELLPWLAKAWNQTSPTTWQFDLREGVRFSNGSPLTSRAVVRAIKYLKTSRGAAEPVGRDLVNVAGVRAISDTSFEITTVSPDPVLPRRLSILRLVEPDLWERLGPDGYTGQPVGTGPYAVERVRPERHVLKSFTDSWRVAPTRSLEFVVIGDPSARQMALQAGQADVALNALSPDEFPTIKAAGGSVFTDQIPAVVSIIFNNVKDTPFRNEKVRRAISIAVNRAGIVDVLLSGQTKVANQPATSAMFGYNPNIKAIPYDPARAKALLSEAGYPKGFSFEMEMPSSTVLYTAAFQSVAADLRKIGVDMILRQLPQVPFQEKVQNGGWTGAAFAWPFFSQISDALYPMRYHSCQWAAPWYCDEITTALIARAAQEEGVEQRRMATMDVMQRAHDTDQAMFLYESVSFVGLGPRIKSFRSDYNFIRYEMITFKPAK